MSETNTENRPSKRKFNRRRRPKSSNQNKDNNQAKKNDRPILKMNGQIIKIENKSTN